MPKHEPAAALPPGAFVAWPKPAHNRSSGKASVACNISADGNTLDVGKQTQNDTCDA